jgi:hypothetical protein
MNVLLPNSIVAYFNASNGVEGATPAHCSTEDAIVHDDGHSHQGLEAIQDCLLVASRQYAYTIEPMSAGHEGASMKVQATVSGTFPGSPIRLEHVLRLHGDKIKALEVIG